MITPEEIKEIIFKKLPKATVRMNTSMPGYHTWYWEAVALNAKGKLIFKVANVTQENTILQLRNSNDQLFTRINVMNKDIEEHISKYIEELKRKTRNQIRIFW